MNAKKIQQDQSAVDAGSKFLSHTLQQLRDAERHEGGLVDVIQQYRDGMAKFNEHELADNDEIQAYAAETYEPPMEILQAWSRPAQSYHEAINALRMADEEVKDGCKDLTMSMMKAALAYFDTAPSASLVEKSGAAFDAVRGSEAMLSICLIALDTLKEETVDHPVVQDIENMGWLIRQVQSQLSHALDLLDRVSLGIDA